MSKKIVIDPGHGGADPGAINGNVLEKDFNLAVSKYMYDRFNDLGIPVYITRDSDETLPRDERVQRVLSAFGNNDDVIVISNHINAGGGEGAEVIYALRNNDNLAKNILNEIGKEGQIARKYYQRRYPGNPTKDYYYILRLTGNTEPVLVEYGFIDNSSDLKKLQNNLLDYGEGVVKAVAEYAGVPYSPPNQVETDVYIVRNGDTLYNIARRYGLTVDELKVANGLTDNFIRVGQRLIIPKAMPDVIPSDQYVVYSVKDGDSLYSIGQKFNVSVDDIINLNQFSSPELSIGQQILVPINSNNDQTNHSEYIVQPGDGLYSIARKFNKTVDEIINANNLTTSILQVGQRLIIPNYDEVPNDDSISDPKYITYIIKSGDTLYGISKRFNVPIEDIKRLNNLESNILSVNQKIYIPSLDAYENYYVKQGDTLYRIANLYGTTVDELKALNNLVSDILTIGQVLRIPS